MAEAPKNIDSKPRTASMLILACALGVLAGVGSYTFSYAEGLSYFSRDPVACINCHIMEPQFSSWQKGGHHHVAVCVDCHLPQDFPANYLAKAENGWRHGQRFTTQDFVEPIVVQEGGQRILQTNCLRCHGALMSASSTASHGTGGRTAWRSLECVHCHATVGHGERTGLGGPPRLADRLPVPPQAP